MRLSSPCNYIADAPFSRRYAIHEYETLIDSSEVELKDWIRIANDIELNYKLYDAFVVLHGTDSELST